MLWREGFRFRLHAKDLPGKPDIVLPKWRAAILVNGCFWHWHKSCTLFRMPATRTEFWKTKLGANRQRDQRTMREIELASWRVAVVWECALRADPEAVVSGLTAWIRSGVSRIEFCVVDGLVVKRRFSKLA